MDQPLNPPNRPRSGAAIVLTAVVAMVIVSIAVLASTPEKAAAAGLSTFRSCDEVAAWGVESQQGVATFNTVGAEIGVADQALDAGAPATSMAAPASAESLRSGAEKTSLVAGSEATGETNVVVKGVDELDIIERLDTNLVLAVAPGRLVIADLTAGRVVAGMAVPPDAQVTYDPAGEVAWVVGSASDVQGLVVDRVSVGAESLQSQGTWSSAGVLVDARRVDDELYLVASDGFGTGPGGPIPFTDGPVPCGEILHPPGPSDPSATLIVALPSTGEVAPVRATEVVGSGQLVHVTTGAAYLATPQWQGSAMNTGIHRFDLATLEHTGSGTVGGSLLNDYSMSEFDGHLRVAITAGGGGFGRPMPGRGVIIDDMGVFGVVGPDQAITNEVAPATAVPEPPETTVPETTVPETTTTTEPVPEQPQPGPDDGLNQVVVLDTDGDLDAVGRTPWFGHAGETLHGIRFDGATAYAVTFLQTDPFYVLNLSDPTAPAIAGEVELPGFSAYLHPIAPGRVVGFGPDERGQAAVKLFDVSNPAAPSVLDTLVLGDESAVVYDPHAYVDMGEGRFAVPASQWRGGTIPESSVVEVQVGGSRLDEVVRHSAELDNPATRAMATGDGWAMLGGNQIVVFAGDGSVASTFSLG